MINTVHNVMGIRNNVKPLSGLFLFLTAQPSLFLLAAAVSQLFSLSFHSCPSSFTAAATISSFCWIPQLAFSSLTAIVTSVDFYPSLLVAADPTILLRRLPNIFFSRNSWCHSCSLSTSTAVALFVWQQQPLSVVCHNGHSFAGCYQSCSHRWSLSTNTAVALSSRSICKSQLLCWLAQLSLFRLAASAVTVTLSTRTAVSFPLESAAVTAEITSLSSPCLKQSGCSIDIFVLVSGNSAEDHWGDNETCHHKEWQPGLQDA